MWLLFYSKFLDCLYSQNVQMTSGGCGEAGWAITEERKWPTLIYPGCSLVWLVLSEHPAASHSLPLSPRDHRSPTSFLQGHKYFPQTPYCFHIILQTQPNDSERQTIHPFSHDMLLSVHTHFTVAEEPIRTPWEASSDMSSRLCI